MPAADRRSRTRLVVRVCCRWCWWWPSSTTCSPRSTWPRRGAAIAAMTWQELATLGLLAVWNLCTYALVWMAVTPGLGFWRAMVMTQATTAVASTVPVGRPSGSASTYSMLGSWGYSRSRTAPRGTGLEVWPNSFIKLGMPVLALALVLLQGGAGEGSSAGGCGRHRRAGDRHRGVRTDAAQRGAGAPVQAAGRPGRHAAAAHGQRGPVSG